MILETDMLKRADVLDGLNAKAKKEGKTPFIFDAVEEIRSIRKKMFFKKQKENIREALESLIAKKETDKTKENEEQDRNRI